VSAEVLVPLVFVDKIMHDGWSWVLMSGVVMCSRLVRNSAAINLA
jgi:hypothetical protein